MPPSRHDEPEFALPLHEIDTTGIAPGSSVIDRLRDLLAEGRTDEAVELYEERGMRMGRDLLEIARGLSPGLQQRYAEMFVRARDFRNGAAAFEMAQVFPHAARLYEQAADFEAAARCFEKSGDLAKAASAWGKTAATDRALQLHQQLGPSEALAELLSRTGKLVAAAGVYRALGHVHGELGVLETLRAEDPERGTAVRRIVELRRQIGQESPSVDLLVEAIRESSAGRRDIELHQILAEVLDRLGRRDHAEQVRRRVAKLQSELVPARPAGRPTTLHPAPPGRPTTVEPVPAARPTASAPAVPAVPRDTPIGSLVASHDSYARLKGIPLFAQLSLADMQDLFRAAKELRFPEGFTVIEQGAPGRGLHVVLAGRLRVLRIDKGGAAREIARRGPGEYVGEMSLLDDRPTIARVVADGEAITLFLARERFDQFLDSHEPAAVRIYRLFTEVLSERLREATERS